MAVQADEVHRRRSPRPVDGRGGVAVGQVEAELGVVLPGGDVLVGVGVDARRDPQQHVGHRTGAGGVEGVEAVELVEAVDDDVAHAGLDRRAQLVDALVVAVQRARVGGHAGRQRDVQLTAAGDVEEHALLVGEPGHRPAQEGLRRVDHPAGAEGVDRLAAAGAHVRLVVDEQRRAVLGGQLVDAAPADHERAVGRDRRRVRQEGAGQRAHDRPTIRPRDARETLLYLAAAIEDHDIAATDEPRRRCPVIFPNLIDDGSSRRRRPRVCRRR